MSVAYSTAPNIQRCLIAVHQDKASSYRHWPPETNKDLCTRARETAVHPLTRRHLATFPA